MAEQQRLVDRLKYLSITDDLTGVYNVRYFGRGCGTNTSEASVIQQTVRRRRQQQQR